MAGLDVGFMYAWKEGILGNGVYVGVVDDGVNASHADLAPNMSPHLDYDWNDDTPFDASPSDDDFHGTAVAGVLGASANNSIGMSGVSPNVRIASLRLIASPTTDEDEANAFLIHNDQLAVKVNSWGPVDGTLQSPGQLTKQALRHATREGRGGKGVIFLFAAGNGGPNDNVNSDGFVASRFVISVTAVNEHGAAVSYGESGACITTSAPIGDYGANKIGVMSAYSDSYTSSFDGSSAAAPMATGVVALLLQTRPDLGWRDVKEIMLRSSIRNDPSHPDWQTNAAGIEYNHWYGGGMANVATAIETASTWTLLGDEMSAQYDATRRLVVPPLHSGFSRRSARAALQRHRGDARRTRAAPRVHHAPQAVRAGRAPHVARREHGAADDPHGLAAAPRFGGGQCRF